MTEHSPQQVTERPTVVNGIAIGDAAVGFMDLAVHVAIAVAVTVIVAFAGSGMRPGDSDLPPPTDRGGKLLAEEVVVLVEAMGSDVPLPPGDAAALQKALVSLTSDDLPLPPPPGGEWTVEHVKAFLIDADDAQSHERLFLFGSIAAPNGEEANTIVRTFYADGLTRETKVLPSGAAVRLTREPPPPQADKAVLLFKSLIACAVLTAAAAVGLIALAVATFAGRRRAVRLHRQWAWTRIVLALLLGAVAYALVFYVHPKSSSVLIVAVAVVLTVAWPITLLKLTRRPELAAWAKHS